MVFKSEPTQAHSCQVCKRPTLQLVGFAAVLLVRDGKRTATRVRSSAQGYCPEHRETVIERWEEEMAAEGRVDYADAPVELHARDARRFMIDVDHRARATARAVGSDPAAKHEVSAMSNGRLRQDCPHCGGRLSWGTGPHVEDAKRRGDRSTPWECRDCGAAGLTV